MCRGAQSRRPGRRVGWAIATSRRVKTALAAGDAQDVSAPEVERAIDRICAAANKAGKIPGIYCRDAERALAMAKRGFKFITIGSDLAIVRDGAAGILKALSASS